MKAKILVYALSALILAAVHLAEAQQPKKVPRIGFLVASSPSYYVNRIEMFRQGLQDLGYVEGRGARLRCSGRWLPGRGVRHPRIHQRCHQVALMVRPIWLRLGQTVTTIIRI